MPVNVCSLMRCHPRHESEQFLCVLRPLQWFIRAASIEYRILANVYRSETQERRPMSVLAIIVIITAGVQVIRKRRASLRIRM